MSAAHLGSLLEQVPRDEHGALQDSPEKAAFVDALAATKPLKPPELLELAASLRSDPKRSQDADAIALQALTAIAHDRDCRNILSKIGADLTPWGVTVNQLRAQISRAYRSPRSAGAGWLEISGTTGRIGVPEGSTVYFADSEVDQNSGDMIVAATCIHGKIYVAPPETHDR
jgi:hypothetical protein